MTPYDMDHRIAATMPRLNGTICTPAHLDRSIVDEIKRRDLMRFEEWPSGHWATTDRGRAYLAALAECDAEENDE